jgi:hypothetical protein
MCLLESCRPVPGYVSQTIFSDSIQPGWTWLPYNAKNTVLLAKGEGVDGSVATCATLSQGGAVKFNCRQCSRPGYQPFAKATSLQFDIRSNTKSDDEFASSTPRGKLPGIKLYLMNVSASVLWFFFKGGLPPGAGGGLPPAGHTQRNQANPTAGGPKQASPVVCWCPDAVRSTQEATAYVHPPSNLKYVIVTAAVAVAVAALLRAQ